MKLVAYSAGGEPMVGSSENGNVVPLGAPRVQEYVERGDARRSDGEAGSHAPRPGPQIERSRRSVSFDAARVGVLSLIDEKAREAEKLGGTMAGSHYGKREQAGETVRLAEEVSAGMVVAGSRERGTLKAYSI